MWAMIEKLRINVGSVMAAFLLLQLGMAVAGVPSLEG
jgi:hypothetical protein